MSQRKYYDDSYTTRFTAQVAETLTYDDHPAVVLGHTFFYPGSGGQPHDSGMLNEVPVVDVRIRQADGAIVHLLAAPLAARAAHGVVDWPRRFDHMQHHTGQHILSQAFLRVAGAPTVGFHLSAESVTIDLQRAALDADLLAAAEALANEIVWENRPVTARLVTHEEAAALDLRKIPAVDEDQLRLVDISDFDLTACGGTHVAATGAVGLIKIIRTSRQRGKLRVEFCCGGRALADYGRKNEMAQKLSARLTVGHWELDEAVARLQESLKQTRRSLKREQETLLAVETAALRAQGVDHDSMTLVREVITGAGADQLRRLAQQLAREASVVALLAAPGPPLQIVAARGKDVTADMGALLAGILADLEAASTQTPSGGGGARFAQGGGVDVPPALLDAVLDAAVERLIAATNDG